MTPFPQDTWLTRLDPRVKLWLVVLGLGLLIAIPDLRILFGVLIAAHAVLLLGGVPARQVFGLWKALVPVVVIILILQPLITPEGVPLAQIGPLRVTAGGLISGLRYAIRLAASAFVVMVLIATTPMPLLVRGFERLGMPYTLGMTVGLALHYVTILSDLYSTISEAQQARGWDLSRRGAIKRVHAAVPTLVAVIIASLRLGESLGLGLAARGFGLRRPRTHYHDLAMTRADWLALGIGSAATIALLAVRSYL